MDQLSVTVFSVVNDLMAQVVVGFGKVYTSFMQKFGGISAPDCGSTILECCLILEGIFIKSQLLSVPVWFGYLGVAQNCKW